MKKWLKIHFKISVVLMLLALCSSFTTQTSLTGLVVITNARSGNAQLSKTDFERIIFGEKQTWPNGTKVYLALLKPTHPTGLKVAKDVFDMSSNEFNKYWLGLVFEGKCKAPTLFSSEDDLITYIMNTPNAIGVVSSSANLSGVKKIQIN